MKSKIKPTQYDTTITRMYNPAYCMKRVVMCIALNADYLASSNLTLQYTSSIMLYF